MLTSRKRVLRGLFDVAIFFLLFFSEFGNKPLDLSSVDMAGVASRLMSDATEPYRAPLRAVTFRKPIGEVDQKSGRVWVCVTETLECAHTLTLHPGENEPFIAKRRRCQQCLEIEYPSVPFQQYETNDDLSAVQPILEYLKNAEERTSEVFSQDDYRVAWKTVLYAAQGNPDPWNMAFSTYYGKNLKNALAAWDKRDRFHQKYLDKIASELAEALPPRKPMHTVKSISKEDRA